MPFGSTSIAPLPDELVADRERLADPVRCAGGNLDEPGRERLGLQHGHRGAVRCTVDAEQRQDS
jgi:hypothetical protein